LTIAGQTAPLPGIEFRTPFDPESNYADLGDAVIVFYACESIVIRYVRVRCTMASTTTNTATQIIGVSLIGVQNVILDHMSIAYCSTNVRIYYVTNVTVQHSLLGNPRGRSSEDPLFGVSMYHDAASSDDTPITLSYNLFTHCRAVVDGSTRMPLELLANVVYNWKYFGYGADFRETANRPAYQK
jgi:hypothetical protein